MGKDWAGYDLTIDSAINVQKEFKVNKEIYYFSFCTSQHKYNKNNGYFWPTLKIHPYLFVLSILIGRRESSEWWENDGNVKYCEFVLKRALGLISTFSQRVPVVGMEKVPESTLMYWSKRRDPGIERGKRV